MMRRFSRKRRGGSNHRQSPIDAGQWLPKIAELEGVSASSLEAWTEAGVPDSLALIGRGQRGDGGAVLVAFSPRSATEALLGGLAAAQQAASDSEFAGVLQIVAPQWPAGARRVLGLVGRTPYSVEPIAAPSLSDGRVVVEPELAPRILAANAAQLASRMVSPASRAAFTRAALALEGLAAKHGGCVRVGLDRIELVVLARRVAEIRADGESAVLEVQLGGRSATPISAADLAGALDGLEGQIRRRLNDRKVREGEDGLRGRVIAQLADGADLRGLRPWPQPGMDVDDIDGVGINADGVPVVVAVREEFEWSALSSVLEALAPLAGLFPVLFAEMAPPLRLSEAQLLLAGERFGAGLEKALSALTLAYELREVSGSTGASVGLVPRVAGEGAEARPARRGRRRGGRGRTSSGEEESESTSEDGVEAVESTQSERRTPPDGPAGPAHAEERDDTEDGGRGRSRRRRRPRRGRGSEGAEGEAPAREARESEDGRGGEGARRKRARFEEVSLMDLDDAPAASETDASDDDTDSDGGDDSDRDRGRRPRRRGRRGGKSDGRRGGGESRADSGRDSEGSEDVAAAEVVEEEDLVDADDLSEILARLTDDVPDFEVSEPSELGYDDEDEGDDEGSGASRQTARDTRRRGARSDETEPEDPMRAAARRRSAIVVHADRDSLLAAILLARDIRQLDGLWVYPQAELMTFFRSVATDLRDDTPIFVVGFSPSPARDVIQASSLYRGRLLWFDRQAWPPEDLVALRESLGKDAIHGGEGIDSTIPMVLENCSRRSRFTDKLVDLATGRFSQHDFERWGRLWRHRINEIASKTGDIRADIAPLLAGRPSDLSKEAALVAVPPPPSEVAWVAARDFRLVHFGGHVMVVLDVDPDQGTQLCARIARERYGATLSLAHRVGEENFVFGGDELIGKRALDYLAVADHLSTKLEWVEGRPDADHVARFRIRDLERHPERLEEVIGEIAMGRSLLER